MKYTKPQLLNTRAASATIKGQAKNPGLADNPIQGTVGSYQSDE
jgi:hypothetical protein